MDNLKPSPINPIRKIVIGISGATGICYAIRLLQVLSAAAQVETHLVISQSGLLTLKLEQPDWPLKKVQALADFNYRQADVSASIASGSFITDSMVIVPASMKTVSAVAHGFGDNLLVRAADVMLKERRRLIVVPREAPLHLVHLRNLATIAEMGGIILPPMPAFYHRPTSVQEIIDQTVARILDLLTIPQTLAPQWISPAQQPTA